MVLCQRFERRIRQCGAFELRISTRVARPNHFLLTETCSVACKSLDNDSSKNYRQGVALIVRASIETQIHP
jgi:hypothetical protein